MQMSVFCFVVLLLWPYMSLPKTSATKTEETSSIAKSGCPEKCGNVSVPYPFGIREGCAHKNFTLICNETFNPARLLLGDLVVRSISVDEGTLVVRLLAAYNCYNRTGYRSVDVNFRLYGPLKFSDTRNKLTAFGCDTVALMKDRKGNFGSGCMSLCNSNFIQILSCSGFGCSQTSVPQNLKTLNITIESRSNHSNVLDSNPCGYAFLTDERSFNATGMMLSYQPEQIPSSNSVLEWDSGEGKLFSYGVIEWVAEEKTCKEAMKNRDTYACRENTVCEYPENGIGYRCKCKQGYKGNPYLEGCQDINECKDPERYTCHGTCKNTIGNYTCRCPLGMHGDGKVGCQGYRVETIVIVIGAITLAAIITFLIVIIYMRRKKERNFLKNGGMLLKNQRVRIFKEKELAKATKDYDRAQFLGGGGFGSVYKGVIDNNILIAVKKPNQTDKTEMNKEEFHKELQIVSQVNHKYVVKILGMCLQTNVPLLVYEFISNGTLYEHIHNKKSQALATWQSRLRVAAQTAQAFDYLHSLADPPIIHGDIKSMNILLDDNFTAKVSDFGASVLTSPDHTIVATKIQGTRGYLDPEYLTTGTLTPKSDVYSFGVVLVELLTGEKPNSTKFGQNMNVIHYLRSSLDITNKISEVICFNVTNDDEMEDIKVFAELAKQCVDLAGIKRPTMKQIAEKLQKLYDTSCAKKGEKTKPTHGQSSSHLSGTVVTPKMNEPDTYTETIFEEGGFSVNSV